VAEDWRLTVRLRGDHGGRLLQALHGHEVEEEVRARFGERIAVSGDGDRVFLYADTEAAAREAEQVVDDLLAAQDVSGEFQLDRWHHLEERWEDASVPLPDTAAVRQTEHSRLEAEETAEAQASGFASWEVRIELPITTHTRSPNNSRPKLHPACATLEVPADRHSRRRRRPHARETLAR
jgi:hypothetical protein